MPEPREHFRRAEKMLRDRESPSSRLEVALTEEWCNGCGLPRKQWGPVCGGMAQGDWTHYHSPEWWQRRYRPRPDYDPRVDHPERYTDGPI
jgi:hypothetical protein